MQIKTTTRNHLTFIRMAYFKRTENDKCWQKMWAAWNLCALLAGRSSGAAIMENSIIPQKVELYHVIQQSHLFVYIKQNSKQDLKEIFVHPYSLQHYSQKKQPSNHIKG